MKQAPYVVLVWVIGMTLASAGCGARSPANVGLVQGTVTMDGSPLANAQVTFSPEGGRPSSGITDNAGKYTLTYVRDIKGAAIGKHSVRIESLPTAPADPNAATTEAPAPQQETIPAKYNADSTLSAEVKAGENTIDFPLESK